MTARRFQRFLSLALWSVVVVALSVIAAAQSAGTFALTGSMTTSRRFYSATLLPSGKVLIAGGRDADNRTLASAELYTPSAPVPAPALFSLSGDGKGQGAIWRSATGQVVSADSPAVAGEALSMYTTSLIHGGVVPPQVAVGGRLAEILFFGDAPGYPGYYQVNFRVPGGIAPGSAAPVRLTYLGRPRAVITDKSYENRSHSSHHVSPCDGATGWHILPHRQHDCVTHRLQRDTSPKRQGVDRRRAGI